MNAGQNSRLLVGVISIGTLLEWAEYTFYGYMAVILSPLFFPENAENVAIMKTFGIFAAGYLMRPLGAIIFGHIGDSFGRKPALLASLLLMGFATFSIGCLPTHATIGGAASMLLLLLRMLQGLAISGEYNGAGIFLVEKVGQRYPCLAGSWVSACAALGMVLGGVAALVTSLPEAPSYAWCIPFLLGGITCFVGMWLRRAVSESYAFVPTLPHHKRQLPLVSAFKLYKKSLLLTGAIAAITGVYVYIGNIYIVVYLKQQCHLPTFHATFFAIFGEILVAIFIPIMAYVADKTDAYRQYRLGLALVAVLSPVIFMLAGTGNYFYILLAMVVYGVLNGILCGPMVKILTDQFPPLMRYSGVSFAWSVSAALFSGSAPMIAQYLTTRFDWALAPSFYVSMVAIMTSLVFAYVLNPTPIRNTIALKQLTD
jgi:MHS family proline/betaine transporter-like MFS transporter